MPHLEPPGVELEPPCVQLELPVPSPSNSPEPLGLTSLITHRPNIFTICQSHRLALDLSYRELLAITTTYFLVYS